MIARCEAGAMLVWGEIVSINIDASRSSRRRYARRSPDGATLTVLTPHRMVDAGANATFECVSDANPAAAPEWGRAGYEMGAKTTTRMTESGGALLTVVDATKDDSGVFVCSAANGIGQRGETHAELVVKCPYTLHRSLTRTRFLVRARSIIFTRRFTKTYLGLSANMGVRKLARTRKRAHAPYYETRYWSISETKLNTRESRRHNCVDECVVDLIVMLFSHKRTTHAPPAYRKHTTGIPQAYYRHHKHTTNIPQTFPKHTTNMPTQNTITWLVII